MLSHIYIMSTTSKRITCTYIMVTSQIVGVLIIYSAICSGADQGKHQSSTSWALWGEFTSDRWILFSKGQQRGLFSIWLCHHAGYHMRCTILMTQIVSSAKQIKYDGNLSKLHSVGVRHLTHLGFSQCITYVYLSYIVWYVCVFPISHPLRQTIFRMVTASTVWPMYGCAIVPMWASSSTPCRYVVPSQAQIKDNDNLHNLYNV